MTKIETTLFEFAEKFIGEHEVSGDKDNPLILYALSLCKLGGVLHDEIPNCSAWMNMLCHFLGLPRSHSAAARSWLLVGRPVLPAEAEAGNDIVVLTRGGPQQPGPDVQDAPGHVGLFHSFDGDVVVIRGGNQGDEFNDSRFMASRILGIRRVA